MKRVLFVALALLIATALVLAVIAPAVASESDWRVSFKASDPSTGVGSVANVGTKTGALDGIDDNDIPFSTIYPNSVYIAVIEPTAPMNPLYSTDLKAPIVPPQTKVWDMVMWCATGYTGNAAKLAWFTGSTYTPPATIGGVPYQYKIEIIRDPTGTYSTGTQFMFPAGATGTSASPVGSMSFFNTTYLKMSNAEASNSGLRLRFSAVPVPEPSSLAALAFGLSGLGVFVRRRR